jgi:hypothetical protein
LRAELTRRRAVRLSTAYGLGTIFGGIKMKKSLIIPVVAMLAWQQGQHSPENQVGAHQAHGTPNQSA